MALHRFSIRIDASPARVFDLFMDLERMREWVGGVTRVTDLTGPVDRPGTRYTVWFGRMRSPTQILEVERPRHVRTRFGNLILKGESDVTFEPDDGGTRLTQEFRTRGLASALVARVFAAGSYRGSFRGELDAFREIVERDDASASEPPPDQADAREV
jgi:uncharacterized protein YndB with AHSA1/START domain